jgi:hypothetical protein
VAVVSSVVLSVEQTAAIAELAREHGEAQVDMNFRTDTVTVSFEGGIGFVVNDDGELQGRWQRVA